MLLMSGIQGMPKLLTRVEYISVPHDSLIIIGIGLSTSLSLNIGTHFTAYAATLKSDTYV